MLNYKIRWWWAGLVLTSALLTGLGLGAHGSAGSEISLEGAKATFRLELARPTEIQEQSALVGPHLLVQGAAGSLRVDLAGAADLVAEGVEPRILVHGAASSALQFAGDSANFVGASPALAARILIQGAATSAETNLARPDVGSSPPVPPEAVSVWLWVLLGVLAGGLVGWFLTRR